MQKRSLRWEPELALKLGKLGETSRRIRTPSSLARRVAVVRRGEFVRDELPRAGKSELHRTVLAGSFAAKETAIGSSKNEKLMINQTKLPLTPWNP